ncbi:hypothetical protein Tco_0483522 [Tanacetum coccineum]
MLGMHTVSPLERVVLMMEGILSVSSSVEKPLLPPGSTGDVRFDMAFVFLGFALIPSDVTCYPKNLPSSTPNEHFLGFSFMFIAFKFSNVSAMSARNIFSSFDFVNM